MTQPPTQEQVERIVAGLTKAQRDALVRHTSVQPYGWPQPARDPTSFCYAGRALMDEKLIDWSTRLGSSTLLTNLGRAVRAHLITKGSDQ